MFLSIGNTDSVFLDYIFRKIAGGDSEKYYSMVLTAQIIETIIGIILFILIVRFLIVVPSECKRKADALESIDESLIMLAEKDKIHKPKDDMKQD